MSDSSYHKNRLLHGVYRSLKLLQAGILALLRHRWSNRQDLIDVRDPQYVGLVIYVSLGDAAT